MSDTPRTDALATELGILIDARPITGPDGDKTITAIVARLLKHGQELERSLSDSVRWIPVSERAPEENQAVLAFWGKDRVHGIDAGARSYAVAVWGAGIWRDVDDPETEYGPATHWMPLPEAPK